MSISLISAKFLKLEQLDQDFGHPTDTNGVSIDGTGQVGTYFYTAPEIEHGWPKIDEKVCTIFLYIILSSWFMAVLEKWCHVIHTGDLT